MKTKLIFCCEITDLSPNSDTATEYLSIFNYDFSSYIDNEHKIVKHILYFDNEKTAETAAEKLAEIPAEWQATGLQFDEIKVFSIEKKDWSEVWKQHFKIQHISRNLTIKPSWLQYEPENKSEIVIEIDPGMSFGTGRHATTRFCMKMLEEIPTNKRKTLLDAGCGSGILTITAKKLNFETITAFDYDADCLECTKENLIQNNIDPDSINLKHADITALSAKCNNFGNFDVTIVNILAHILYSQRKTIVSFMKPDSFLILSGILTREYPKIRDAFVDLGLKEIKNLTEDEWTSVFFKNVN